MKKFFFMTVMIITGLIFSSIAFAEEITIVGTGSGMSILEAIGKEFTRQNPDIKIHVPKSIGSGGGIKSVGNDLNKIGRVARGIKEKEKHYGLTQVPIVKMPIVFFINKNIGVKDLSARQICDIYSAKITNWKDVGGKDSRIKVIRREDGDSSLKVLQGSFPGFKDITITDKSKTTYSDQETLESVEKIGSSISFGTFGNARGYNVDILKIDGKAPDKADYPYNGILSLIYKEQNNKGNIRKFVMFAQSDKAHSAIKDAGGMPGH